MNHAFENDQEAMAFNQQILERIQNGHIPDIRRAKSCPYFYNNPWREPYYVKIDFAEQANLFYSTLRTVFPETAHPKILEIGCGAGYLSLELARNGCVVTGIDLSEECIRIARRFALEDPWVSSRAGLDYVCGDILNFSEKFPDSFDAIVMLGTQHHFKDQDRLMNTILTLLKQDGYILAHEPTRDRMTKKNAAVIYLIQALLSEVGGYYQKSLMSVLPKTAVEDIFSRAKYEDKNGKKLQSVHDNDAGYSEMIEALNRYFTPIRCEDRYAFYHDVIGGLRFDDEKNAKLAQFLHDMDLYLCELGVLQATEFFYVGKRGVS
jgi:2-polyprenyl-3-methyl-5-hydroxy-6-metoxy-1,4-benzoquinol methylase